MLVSLLERLSLDRILWFACLLPLIVLFPFYVPGNNYQEMSLVIGLGGFFIGGGLSVLLSVGLIVQLWRNGTSENEFAMEMESPMSYGDHDLLCRSDGMGG